VSLWSVWSIWFGGVTINGTEAEDQAIRLEQPGASEQALEKLVCLLRISGALMCGTTEKHSRRMLKKAVQQGRRRIETGGVPSGYVEDFDEPRTTLADFFSILLGGFHTVQYFAHLLHQHGG
jgi:hypothetical protein